jgi:tetratricopeptide (TPR) repeat protein/tRNA A-37 threonylcarbamoyl transferase component Bud32
MNAAAAPAGTMIGPYRLVRQIGEGGMGLVYHAQQIRPIRREVALKIIKPGMDSRQVIARFESERQALALMDHANIARVYDAGATSTGLPYFVMEYVDGVPITRYCDSERLNLKERIALFIPVCRAIQHAHQKGIIHRDIKPSNVLVGKPEGKPTPKVIDFGLAKALGQKMTDSTMLTSLGSVVGTLQYMSPEQADLGKPDIDTRSDVYSLGVLLYELMTGSTPLEHESLARGGYLEILQRIREEEPVPPSSRTRGSGKTAEIARRRGADAAHYSKLLHGELDWIVLKALEKDRARRYETANGMARDLERYLAGEPLEAAPPSAAYRFGKLIRKHRLLLSTAAGIALLLIAGVVATSWMAVRARRAEREALVERNAAQSVTDFLQNDLLAQAGANAQAGQGARPDPEIKVRTALDRAAARIEGKFAAQPRVEAAIRYTLGATYENLGIYMEGHRHAARAVELRRRELGEEHPDTISALRLVATLDWYQGRYAEAEALMTRVLPLQVRLAGEEDPSTLSCLNILASSLAYQGKLTEAERIFSRQLFLEQKVLGAEHPKTLYVMNNLAAIYFRRGEFSRAEQLHAQSFAIRRRVQSEEHPGTLTSWSNLGEVYVAEGKYAEAESAHAQVLAIRRRVLGPEHPDTLTSGRNLAAAYRGEGKYAEAEALFRSTLETRRRVLGPEHPKTLASMRDLATLYRDQRKYEQAESLLITALDIQRRVSGSGHPDTLDDAILLGEARLLQSRFALAESTLGEVLPAFGKSASDSWQGYKAESLLGAALAGQSKYAEAEPLLLSGHAGLSRLQTTIPASDRTVITQTALTLARLYERLGKPDRAAQWGQRSVEAAQAGRPK